MAWYLEERGLCVENPYIWRGGGVKLARARKVWETPSYEERENVDPGWTVSGR